MKATKENVRLLLLLTILSKGIPQEECDCSCDCKPNYNIGLGECCDEDPGTGTGTSIATPTQCVRCPPGYFVIGEYGCYFSQVATASNQGWSHDSAELACEALNNGRLASMDNATMFDAIHSKIVGEQSGVFQLFWLSAEYHGTDFFWGDGRILMQEQYQWWQGNNPANAEDGFCVYAFGNQTHNNCLSYIWCTVKLGFICEHDFLC